ncbi:MAG TPA: phosphopantothenoylcysteine decarboxylase [Chitinophagales bacterium]|nr:phosphopantothenoylcysteine decarboxylase [Chitinophagales bacterium]
MKALITAGPTYEPIDPVRFIGNRSSGKMGIAIANEFAGRGYEVILVKGPTHLKSNHTGVTEIEVETAAQMYEQCAQYFPQCDVIIFSAAVADYTPKNPSPTKIKKAGNEMTVELVKTKDIAGELGKTKKPNQVVVGFALETDNELHNAQQKLYNKHLDFIILNSVKDAGAAFQHDTNKVTILDNSGKQVIFELKPKTEVAKDIANYVSVILESKKAK